MQEVKKRILIISSAEDEESTTINNEFVAKLQKELEADCSVEWVNYHDIRVEFESSSLRVFLRSQELELNVFDFVYFKSYFRYSELAGVIASYLDHEGIKFVSSELRNHIPLTKLTQFARLALNDIPIIKTVFMLNPEFRQSFKELEAKLSVPFIFKSIDGSGGDENYLVKTEDDLISALSEFPTLHFVAQSFVQNDSDYRVLIVNHKVELIIKRQRIDDSTHLNNTSQGARAALVDVSDIDPSDIEICLKSARLLDREVSGVDLLYELNTKKPYVLEVNASPQIGSGAFTEEKLSIYSNFYRNMLK